MNYTGSSHSDEGVTMKDSVEAERLERANRLRRQIEDLTQGRPTPDAAKGKESPAQFIHRRMEEIKQEEGGGAKSG
jgi:hypothetical protein